MSTMQIAAPTCREKKEEQPHNRTALLFYLLLNTQNIITAIPMKGEQLSLCQVNS